MSFTGSTTPQSMSIGEAVAGTDAVQDAYGAFSANHSTGEAALLPALSRELPRAWRLTVKRLVDILLSTIALAALLPVLLVVGLAILLSEGRPIFFNWDVIGQDGRPFRGYKFRTMVVDAEAQRAALAASNEMRGPVFKMRNDPRVTRIGAVLRRYSIDELPQLWSVLKGDMSLVGPRPLGHGEYASATPYQRQKLSVTPPASPAFGR